MAEQEFKTLFSPIKVGSVTLPNRIVMTGAIHRLTGERLVQYFAARAKGGAGMIISSPHHPSATTEQMIPELKQAADAVHQYPTKIFAQLCKVSLLEGGDNMPLSILLQLLGS